MTSINNLENALARIDTIRARIASFSAPEAPQGAPSFDAILGQVSGEKANQKEVTGQLAEQIQEKANQYNLDPNLVKAVVQAESGFNPKAVSKTGAMGLMQLMPGTAQELGVTNAFDPEQNLDGGVRYLKGLMGKYNSLPKAVAAYNAGPGAVDKYNGVPPYAETQAYTRRVLSLYEQNKTTGGSSL